MARVQEASSCSRGNTSQSDEAGAAETQTPGYKKSDLLGIFFEKYGFRLPIETTPGESTFALVTRSHKNKSCEFIPLSRVTSAVDARDVGVDHVRINGTNGDLLFDPTRSITRRNADFGTSSGAFLRAIRILMNSYVLASGNDSDDLMWRTLQAATRHITAVESCARACARVHQGVHPKLLECEMAVRKDWHRVATAEPGLLLSDINELVSQRHSIWPTTFELKATPSIGRDHYRGNNWVRRGAKAKGKGARPRPNDDGQTDVDANVISCFVT